MVRVNRKWLSILGYRQEEVLGLRAVDFLVEVSRTWTADEALPLFWRDGSARSIGVQFLQKDGRVLDLLLDTDLDAGDPDGRHIIACIRDSNDITLWHQSITMIHALLGLAAVRRTTAAILAEAPLDPAQQMAGPRDSPVPAGLATDAEHVDEIMQVVRQVSSSLCSLGSFLADAAGTVAEQEANLLAVAEAVSVFCGKLPWVTAFESALGESA